MTLSFIRIHTKFVVVAGWVSLWKEQQDWCRKLWIQRTETSGKCEPFWIYCGREVFAQNLKPILGVENPNNHVFQLFFNIKFSIWLPKLYLASQRTMGVRLKIFSANANQLFFLCDLFSSNWGRYSVTDIHMDDGSYTGSLPLRVLCAFIELSVKFRLVIFSERLHLKKPSVASPRIVICINNWMASQSLGLLLASGGVY